MVFTKSNSIEFNSNLFNITILALLVPLNILGNASFTKADSTKKEYVSNQNSFEKLPEGTYETKKEDFSKDFEKDGKYFHITEKGDTIVSSKTKTTLEDNLESIQDYSQDPRYGLNMYVPAYDSTYSYTTDFYGSGDINGDGVINQEDVNSSITSTDPFNDGNYRGDTDLDGDVDAADKQIIQEYVDGFRNHINRWELESESEKINHLQKALAIDPTDQISATSSGWDCNNFTYQTFINFNGVYDINNSPYAEDNGTNLQYDLSHNGIFRISLRNDATMTLPGVTHAINSVLLGSPENQNATDFYERIFFEPQTDEIQEIGDYSLNDFAKENWYGWYFNLPFQQWWYGSRTMVEYDLSSGSPLISFQNPDLVLSWNPFEQIKNPEDQDLEFSQGMVIDPGYPDSLYYAGTKINHLTNSNQTSNGSCSDVTFEEEHLWNYEAGAYNSSNTPSATHIQYINVHDFTAPEFEVNENGPYNIWDNSGLPVTFEEDSTSTQGVNPNNSNFYNYEIIESYEGSDVCGNSKLENYVTQVEDLEGPIVTSYPISNNDTIVAPDGVPINPDSLEAYGVPAWATWEDPQNSPIVNKMFEDSLTYEDNIKKIWFRKEFAEDVSGNPSQNVVEHYVLEPKTTGIKDNKTLESKLKDIFPNPTNGVVNIKYSVKKGEENSFELFDLSGKSIMKFTPNEMNPFSETQDYKINISNLPDAIYFLRFNGTGETKKIAKQ